MWNSSKSLHLTRICVFLFMLILLALDVFAVLALLRVRSPFIYLFLPVKTDAAAAVMLAGSVPGFALLVTLEKLLTLIGGGELFTFRTVTRLRIISWECFLGAGVCLLGGCYAHVFFVVAGAAAFMGLIIRVIKNVFEVASEMRAELDLTV